MYYNPYQQLQAQQCVQSYGQNYVQPYGQPNQQPEPRVIPVRDELTARSAQIPMDGSETYFLNKDSGEIYSKRLSMVDGSIVFECYKKREPEFPEKERYATIAMLEELSERLKRLEGGNEQ